MCTKFHQVFLISANTAIAAPVYFGQSKTEAERITAGLMTRGIPYQWLIDGEIYEEFEQ